MITLQILQIFQSADFDLTVLLRENMSRIEVQESDFAQHLKKIWWIQRTHVDLELQKMFW